MIAYSLRIGTALALLATSATVASARQHSHSSHRHARHAALIDAHSHHHTRHSAIARHHHGSSRGTIARHDHGGVRHAGDAAGVSRSCLTPDTRNLLSRLEAAFGSVQIVSTCRPGAVIAGTGHPSEHRYGRAVDFNAPSGKKAAIVQWLIANNPSGGTMTYASMGHIHMDTGRHHFVSLNSGGGGGRHHARYAALARHDGTQGSVAVMGRADTSYPVATGGGDWSGSGSGWGPSRSGESAQPRRRYAHHRHGHHARG